MINKSSLNIILSDNCPKFSNHIKQEGIRSISPFRLQGPNDVEIIVTMKMDVK